MKKILFLISISLFFVLQSCGNQGKLIQNTQDVTLQNTRKFLSNYKAAQKEVPYVQIKSNFNAEVDQKTVSAVLRLYVETNQKIWANVSLFGITGARALITPEGVKAYNVLDKEYIDGDFDFFNQKLKVDFIDYKKLEQLLLGRLFLIDNEDNYKISIQDNQYILSYEPQNQKGVPYKHQFYIDSQYNLSKVWVQNPEKNQSIEVTYDQWQKVNEMAFPGVVNIVVKGKNTDKVHIQYNSFDFKPAETPFKIPSNYKPLLIK